MEQFLLTLARGHLLLLQPLVQVVFTDSKPGRHFGDRATSLNELVDRFDLELFRKSQLINPSHRILKIRGRNNGFVATQS